MKLVANPPTPWPNWQAPVSTRKTRPTVMERAVEGKISKAGCTSRKKSATRSPALINETEPRAGLLGFIPTAQLEARRKFYWRGFVFRRKTPLKDFGFCAKSI